LFGLSAQQRLARHAAIPGTISTELLGFNQRSFAPSETAIPDAVRPAAPPPITVISQSAFILRSSEEKLLGNPKLSLEPNFSRREVVIIVSLECIVSSLDWMKLFGSRVEGLHELI
jgi:hypothetical protein